MSLTCQMSVLFTFFLFSLLILHLLLLFSSPPQLSILSPPLLLLLSFIFLTSSFSILSTPFSLSFLLLETKFPMPKDRKLFSHSLCSQGQG